MNSFNPNTPNPTHEKQQQHPTSRADDKQLMHSTTSSLHVKATDMSDARSRRGTLAPAADPKCSSDPDDPLGLASSPSPLVIARGGTTATAVEELEEEAERLWACWNALATRSTKVSTPPCITNRRTFAGWLSMQTRTNYVFGRHRLLRLGSMMIHPSARARQGKAPSQAPEKEMAHTKQQCTVAATIGVDAHKRKCRSRKKKQRDTQGSPKYYSVTSRWANKNQVKVQQKLAVNMSAVS